MFFFVNLVYLRNGCLFDEGKMRTGYVQLARTFQLFVYNLASAQQFGVFKHMIRFLQTPGPIKKIVLGGLLTVVCVLMAITLIPGFGSCNFLSDTPAQGVVADGFRTGHYRQRRRAPGQADAEPAVSQGRSPGQCALPFFAQRAAENLISEKVLLVEAQKWA